MLSTPWTVEWTSEGKWKNSGKIGKESMTCLYSTLSTLIFFFYYDVFLMFSVNINTLYKNIMLLFWKNCEDVDEEFAKIINQKQLNSVFMVCQVKRFLSWALFELLIDDEVVSFSVRKFIKLRFFEVSVNIQVTCNVLFIYFLFLDSMEYFLKNVCISLLSIDIKKPTFTSLDTPQC